MELHAKSINDSRLVKRFSEKVVLRALRRMQNVHALRTYERRLVSSSWRVRCAGSRARAGEHDEEGQHCAKVGRAFTGHR